LIGRTCDQILAQWPCPIRICRATT
jgi:hypothetical protein